MTTTDERVSAPAFEDRYRSAEDPWNYKSSTYEQMKYRTTLESLARENYVNAFEPACSIGELTFMLAPRCQHLLATDFSPTAVDRARHRCRDHGHVTIECQDLRLTQPAGPFDLILLSEVGYYFDSPSLDALVERLSASLAKGGEFVAVHWCGTSPDHILHADEVHRVLTNCLPLNHSRAAVYPGFRLNTWVKQ